MELDKVAETLGLPMRGMHLLSRGGKPLLALPTSGGAASRALRLYQPQRGLAKLTASLLRKGSSFGLHRLLLPKVSAEPRGTAGNLLPAGTDPESVGVLFGSAEHRVFRAVLSYRNGNSWEVGKLAAGEEGAAMLDHEAAAMAAMARRVPEIPELLGLEAAGNARLLRMPYFNGRALVPGDAAPVGRLLDSWLSDAPLQPLCSFPEWMAISGALGAFPGAAPVRDSIASLSLRPSVRHGDLARWNLLMTDTGELKVLDWEWGEEAGLPGIDLAHFIAQDLRLVQRLPDGDVIAGTLAILKKPLWRDYLARCGWQGHEPAMILAYLAFKQGAGHQDNLKILETCVRKTSGT